MGRRKHQRRAVRAEERRRHAATAAEEIAEALDWLSGRCPELADDAIGRLVSRARTALQRRVVTRQLCAELVAGVDGAWSRGWRPTDLQRLAGRELDASAQAVVVDAMTAQLSTYAVSTLAPDWPDQLRAIEANRWWPRELDAVTARAEADGFEASVTASLAVAAFLRLLPSIERIDPLPGTARPAAPGRTGGPVDARQLELVRKLLAKAESTTFEAEAETFTAAAQSLMARHSIDAALLSSTDPRRGDGPTPRRVWIERPYEREKVLLLGVVADANRCRTVWNKELGFVTVVGYAADLTAAEAIFTSLLVQATSALAGEGRRTSPFGGSRTRSFRQSFLAAYASRIGDRLRVAADAATADVLRDYGRDEPHGRGDRSQELVCVLEQRSEDVDAAVEALFPRLRFRKTRLATDPEGWQAGRRAADSATLHGSASTLERGA